MGREGGRGWGKEPQSSILFPCDVNVAAGGHVDFKPTHYYCGAAAQGFFFPKLRKLKDTRKISILLHILIFHKITRLEKIERVKSAMIYSYPRNCICVGGQRHPPAALPPGKNSVTVYRRLGS